MYEVTHSDPQDTNPAPRQYTGSELAKQYPDIARFVFTLPAAAEVSLTSYHPNREPFVLIVKVLEPDPTEVIDNRIWRGFTLKELDDLEDYCPTESPWYSQVLRAKERLKAALRGTLTT